MDSFKGIWIPLELLNIEISWTKRILIAEISQLEMLDKGCIASNSHFSKKLKISKQAISKALNEMSKDGLILINNAQTKRNYGREITINFSKSGINFSVSGIHQSGESKENKTINKTISEYDNFLMQLKEASIYKSKVTKTKEANKLFEDIEDKQKLFSDYIQHQKDKQEYSVRITKYLEDYKTVYANNSVAKKQEAFSDVDYWGGQQ